MSLAAANLVQGRQVVAMLRTLGMRYAVVAPGSRSTPLALAIDAEPEIDTMVVIDERSAAFFALGMARAAQAPVAMICTSGSAAAHALPALQEAWATNACLVLLSADRPPELHGVGANQTIPQAGFAAAYVRLNRDLAAPDGSDTSRQIAALRHELAALWAERPGPVHLNFRFREPLWEPDADAALALTPADDGYVSKTHPDEAGEQVRSAAAVDHVALTALVQAATGKRGVFVVGPSPDGFGCRAEWHTALTVVARALGWPLLADTLSGLSRDDDEVLTPELVARAGLIQRWPPEIVVRFGRGLTSRTLEKALCHVRGRVWQIDTWGDVVDPEAGTAPHTVRAQPSVALAALSAVPGCSDPTWRKTWIQQVQCARSAMSKVLRCPDWEGALAASAAAALAPCDLLHIGNSMPVRDLDAFALGPTPPVYASRGVSGIDGGIATFAGEAWVRRPRRALALIGDLAFQHDVGSLAVLAAVRREVDAKVMVVLNGGGGIFGFLPIAGHPSAFERLFLTPQQFDVIAAAAAFGLQTRCVDNVTAAVAALSDPDVAVIGVHMERAQNLTRHREAWRAVTEALRETEGYLAAG